VQACNRYQASIYDVRCRPKMLHPSTVKCPSPLRRTNQRQ